MDPGTTRWLDERQQVWWRAYLSGSTALADRLDRDLRDTHQISMSEYEVLVRLSEATDRSERMAALADSVSHSRSRTTHTIARLERAGYVARRRAADRDGRGVTATLTDAGFALLEQAAHTHVRGVREYFLDLAGDDLEVVARVMERSRERLDGATF